MNSTNFDDATRELQLSLLSPPELDMGSMDLDGFFSPTSSAGDAPQDMNRSPTPVTAPPVPGPVVQAPNLGQRLLTPNGSLLPPAPLAPSLSALVADAPGARGGGSFRLQSKKLMLTYRGHLDKHDLASFLALKFSSNLEFKICHEEGSTGYLHTHALVSLDKTPDIKNNRFFDFNGAHPNIAVPKSVRHWQNMVSYVAKEDDDCLGEITVAPSSSDKFSRAATYVRGCTSLRQVLDCPEVEVAMTIASRLPYFTQLWNHCGKKTHSKAVHSTGFSREKLDLSHNWLIYGAAGTGKTNFALSHFEHPILVSHIDDLKKICDETDGLVFDDMSFNKYPHGSIVHLLDREVDRTIHARYFNATIPANLPKIFTANRDDIFIPENTVLNEDQEKALKRRYKTLHVTASLF